MTDKFVVPEPSEAAVKVGRNTELDLLDDEPQPRPYAAGLRAAYAVDLPLIARAEVERALVEANLAFGVHSSNVEWRQRYLASRFPAPEDVADDGRVYRDVEHLSPQPSAEPQTATAAGAMGGPLKFAKSEKGWRCRVCREEVVSPAHPMFHKCLTPSAGERCPSCGDRLGLTTHFCGNRIENTDIGFRVPTPSAGETKCFKCTRDCKWPDRLCDTSCAVGPRPDAADDFVPNPGHITPAERAFLRRLADALGRNDTRSFSNRLDTYGGPMLEDAARKVAGE